MEGDKMSRRLLIGFLVVLGLVVVLGAAEEPPCPGVCRLSELHVSIQDAQFVETLESGSITMRQAEPDKFRIAAVTLRIEKPEGLAITLPAADVSLHYARQNDDYDVAPCQALSNFTVNRNEDRKLEVQTSAGPAWVKIRTGTATRQASAIYVDAVFATIQKDVNRLWIVIGQPATPGYPTRGWE
jgi:hypothetical protein